MLSTSETILLAISYLGIAQGIFLALLIYFHPRSDRSVNIFLALYIISLCAVLCFPLVMQLFTWKGSFFIEPLPLMLGPTLYFYTRSLKEKISWRKMAPHLLAFLIFLVLSFGYFSYLKNRHSGNELSGDMWKGIVGKLFSLLKIAWFLFYYFLVRRSLHSYQRSIQHLFSETSRIDLKWAGWLNNGTILLIVLSIVINSIIYFYPQQFYLLWLLNIALITPYFYIIAYKGITQSTLWREAGVSKENMEEKMEEAGEIESGLIAVQEMTRQKPGLHASRKTEMLELIAKAMQEDKLYREPELTLQNLSDRLQFPSYQVSQVINEGLKKNFYDLINGYRVEEAKRLLLDDKNRSFTILSVGFEAGFNSKTTFNTVFKKFTGLTPTEFRGQSG